ncbi:MAG: hypothetical protein LBG72_06455, partial [Spirochaetaceae bacterium]|nr:hypothetical protein [Spirochaetaceae bacterium]
MSKMKLTPIFFLVFAALFSCRIGEVTDDTKQLPPSSKTVDFGSSTQAVVNVAEGKSVVLVKINFGSVAAASASTGGVASFSGGKSLLPESGSALRSMADETGAPASDGTAALDGTPSLDGAESYRYKHYAPAQEFNANPPPYNEPYASIRASRAALLPAEPGDTKSFWIVADEENTSNPNFIQKSAVLRAASTHSEIWVIENAITADAAQAIAAQFDTIYKKETALLGYEKGGDDGSGGVDGNLRVLILVYPFSVNDIIGYFWSKDEYADPVNQGMYRSNQAEIFYLNSRHSGNTIYSTLAHEFQHMIHFNQKNLKHRINTAAWFNEMLSLITEDVIDPFVGINITSRGHPAPDRLPAFLAYYYETGITEYPSTSQHYANVYAFGAYLVRNYGGPALLAQMVQNEYIDEMSIEQAVLYCTGANLTFDTLLENYPSAMLNK